MDNVESMPPDVILSEKRSRKDRILLEVMEKLWRELPAGNYEGDPCFFLESGHKCWLKRFSKPQDRDGELRYGFDILIEDGAGVDHLEFLVTCTGFGGSV